MVNVIQLFSVVFPMAAAATLMAGYSYMEERERRQENAVLKALEEMSKVLAEETSRWEERHLSQDKRIRDILQIEKRLEDVEAEQKRVRRERNQWKKEESLLPATVRGIEVSSPFLTTGNRTPVSSPSQFLTTGNHTPVSSPSQFLTTGNRTPVSSPSPIPTTGNRTPVSSPSPILTTGNRTPEKEPSVCKLTLDPNTAHRNLSLTENFRKATRVTEIQYYSPHPDRFDYWEQVLCTEGLTGRCYWEVDWSGRVSIAMAYRGINRRGVGGDCGFGHNDKSWSLECYKWKNHKRCSVRHNKKTTELPVDQSGANRVGVYLDSAAGKLSFYSISSDTWTHLHTFQSDSEITEPLYPGFMFGSDSSVFLYQMESI